MKILILNYEFPPLGGGAGNATYHIGLEMEKLGHNIKIITTGWQEYGEIELEKNLRVHYVNAGRKKKDRSRFIEQWFYLKEVLKLKKSIKTFGPEYIISFFGLPCGIAARRLSKYLKIPYLISLRGADVPEFISAKYLNTIYKIISPYYKKIWKEADWLVANSEALKKLALKFDSSSPIQVIFNGVDTQFFQPVFTENSITHFIFVGRLSFQKGVVCLFEALGKIKNNDWILHIVGDGPEKEKLISIAKTNNFNSQIKWHGWCSKETIRDLFKQTHVFVLPSFDEGMSNAMLEAAASGQVLVVSDIPPNIEFIKDEKNGLVFPAGNAKELENIMSKILRQPELIKPLGHSARKLAERYSWNKVAKDYLALI